MDKFDIGRLTDFDFEVVCKDIFEDCLSISLELFAPGRDGGIDLRGLALGQKNSPLIIQCKHWMSSGPSKLISHLRREELPKIRALSPERYILATSVGLTPADKAKIETTLQPYVLSPSDIYGLHEIESMLRARPHIVKNHMRLWLSSTGVLQAIVDKSILTRSANFVEDAKKAAQIYVPNQSYHLAAEILHRHHVCMISGIPGVGKTTLAQVLAVTYAAKGYEVYEISEDIDDVDKLWNEQRDQFFYYDDFLGQTTLGDKLNKNEDARLISVLNRVARSSNKRIVLTTREYILEQARQRYEKIYRHDFRPGVYVIDVRADYTEEVKAQVLYNHIYFSALPSAAKAVFANPSIFRPIVGHRNFNPRLVESSLQMCAIEGIGGAAIAHRVMETLEEPHGLWAHVVNNQLDDASVHLLTVLFSVQTYVAIEDLWRAYQLYCETIGFEFSEQVFKRSLKLLEATMVKTYRTEGEIEVGFHNPSIADYMKLFLAESPRVLLNLLRPAVFFEQVNYLCIIVQDPREQWLRKNIKQLRLEISDALVRTHLVEGCTRTLTLFGLVRETDMTYRMARLLEIAEELGLVELDDVVATFLQLHSVNRLSRHEHNRLRLIRSVWKSTLPQVRAQREELINSYVEGTISEIDDWDTAKRAQDFLDELDDEMISPAIYEKVQDALDQYAEEKFEEVASGLVLGEWGTFDEVEGVHSRALVTCGVAPV